MGLTGYIGVTLHPDLKPYLLQVHRDYARFQLAYAVRMESKYAIRLYKLLQRWAFVGKKRITVDDLRLCLGTRELGKNGEIIKDNLPAYKNLKQKALTPADGKLANQHAGEVFVDAGNSPEDWRL